MPTGYLGTGLKNRVEDLETNFASGYENREVTGISEGFGGIEPAVYVPTIFIVKSVVANIARNIGEMKVVIPESGTGFYVEYKNNVNEIWELAFNWYARG